MLKKNPFDSFINAKMGELYDEDRAKKMNV